MGRVFDGLGRPNDGLPDPIADRFIDVNGEPMNPERREYPTSFSHFNTGGSCDRRDVNPC